MHGLVVRLENIGFNREVWQAGETLEKELEILLSYVRELVGEVEVLLECRL